MRVVVLMGHCIREKRVKREKVRGQCVEDVYVAREYMQCASKRWETSIKVGVGVRKSNRVGEQKYVAKLRNKKKGRR